MMEAIKNIADVCKSAPRRLALHPCTRPGCGKLIAQGTHCPDHVRSQSPARGTTADRGYDADHKALRVACFERDGWKCIDCGWEPEIVRLWRRVGAAGSPPAKDVLAELRRAFARRDQHLHADHEIPIEQNADLRLDPDNLRTRCNRCHSRKTAREDGGFTGRKTAQNAHESGSFARETTTIPGVMKATA